MKRRAVVKTILALPFIGIGFLQGCDPAPEQQAANTERSPSANATSGSLLTRFLSPQVPCKVEVKIDKSSSNAALLKSELRTFNALLDECLGGQSVRMTTFGSGSAIVYDGTPDDSNTLKAPEEQIVGMPDETSTSVELALEDLATECRRKSQPRIIVLLTDGGFTRLGEFQRTATALAACQNIKALILIGVQPGDRVGVEKVLKPLFGDRLICAGDTDRATLPEKLRPLLR